MKILLRFTSCGPAGAVAPHTATIRASKALLRHRQATILEVRKVACNGFLDAVDGALARPTLTGAAGKARTLGDPVAALGAHQHEPGAAKLLGLQMASLRAFLIAGVPAVLTAIIPVSAALNASASMDGQPRCQCAFLGRSGN
jgi:hypothetical protein